jgi:phenylalanyl-tRNA synthetase alpha chain
MTDPGAEGGGWSHPDIAAAAVELEKGAAGVDTHAAFLELKGKMIGRERGVVTALLARLRTLPKEEKAAFGGEVNRFKVAVEARLAALEGEIDRRLSLAAAARSHLDVTLPGRRVPRGRRHPVALVREEIESIFVRMGWDIADGPEVEDDYHNFEALNMPAEHPARDAQDTFFLRLPDERGNPRVLRTHTSPVQIRTMESRRPPLRIVIPGRTYRRDSDLRHSPMFHQVEGLAVGPDVSLGHMKAVLETFLRELFSKDAKIRLRPSYFPFVEPGAEVDVSCIFCDGNGAGPTGPCRVCSASGWIEILGAGMVDPRVFRFVGYDPEEVTGFAFGMGIDRIAMLKYGIPDLRLLFNGDLRLAEAFA